ncbi:MAG: hypothetical protein V4635_02035 [Bacteroidota bacterium]
MKKIIFAFTLLASLTSFGQFFEGKIVYKNYIKSKTPKMTDVQWTQMLGSKQEYFIGHGNYKSVSNGSMAQYQLYVNKENRVYTKLVNSETVYWADASVNADAVIKAVIIKNARFILGYSCDELTLTCKSGVQKYYFAPGLPVDISLFENHKYGNWYEFLKNSKSLTLKTIIDTPQFTMEATATEVTPMKLGDKFFSLPANTKTEKSPY